MSSPSVTKPADTIFCGAANCAHKDQVMIWHIVLTAAFLGPAPLRPPPPRTQRSPQCAAPDLVSALTLAEDMSLPVVPDFDLLDAFLAAPLLIPILGAVALQTGGRRSVSTSLVMVQILCYQRSLRPLPSQAVAFCLFRAVASRRCLFC